MASSSSNSDSSRDETETRDNTEQQPKLITELKPNETSWTSKLIVASKQSPKKGQAADRVHQTMTLIDPKVNKIRGIIFNKDVESLKHKLELGKTYLISNALIQEEKMQYKTPGVDLNITFKQGMPIEEIDEDNTSLIESLYAFTPLSECAKHLGSSLELNVCGIVLHIFEKKHVNGTPVQNVLIIDDSLAVMRISMWGNFAENECLAISAISKSKPIVAIVNLRIGTHKESVTMTTKTNTCVFINPEFEIAQKLKTWRDSNMSLLNKLAREQQQTPSIQIIPAPKLTAVQSLKHFLETTVNSTSHGNMWVNAKFVVKNYEQQFTYIGCGECKRATPTPKGNKFICYGCNGKLTKAMPCLRIEVQLWDDNDLLEAVMFGSVAEKLFKCNASDVHKLIEQANNRNLLKTIFKVEKKKRKIFYVHHSPNDSSSSQQIRYVVNQVYNTEEVELGQLTGTSESEIIPHTDIIASVQSSTDDASLVELDNEHVTTQGDINKDNEDNSTTQSNIDKGATIVPIVKEEKKGLILKTTETRAPTVPAQEPQAKRPKND